MRLLGPIILILFSTVDRLGGQLSMCNTIASQFIGDDLPGLTAMAPQQAPEEPLSRSTIPLGLKIYINHFAILVDRSPQIVLFSVGLHEDFIEVEGIAKALVLSLQATGINGTEFYAPGNRGQTTVNNCRARNREQTTITNCGLSPISSLRYRDDLD